MKFGRLNAERVRVNGVYFLAVGVLVSTLIRPAASRAGDELPRRGLMGVQLAPVSVTSPEPAGAEPAKGVLVTVVMPDTAAQKAGLQGNDLIVKVGDTDIADLQAAMRALRGYYAGDTVKLAVVRKGEKLALEVKLHERPRETSTDYDVAYDSFGEKGARIRVIVTRPKVEGKSPAVLFVQGPAPFSMDFGVMPQHPFKGLVEQLTKHGYIVMRVERPGVGDSEGADPQATRLAEDVAVFKNALRKLKNLPFVDAESVFVLGHSGGTILAPKIVKGESVRGVITYGAFGRPLVEDSVEAAVRRWKLELLTDEEIATRSGQLRCFLKGCYVDKLSPKDVVARHPDVKELVEPLLQGDALIEGIHYEYWQELAATRPSEDWSNVDAPVLALWGEADFVAAKENSELIVSAVNKNHPNGAELVVVPGADHMYNKAEDQEESFLAGGRGAYNPATLEAAEKWMKKQLSPK